MTAQVEGARWQDRVPWLSGEDDNMRVSQMWSLRPAGALLPDLETLYPKRAPPDFQLSKHALMACSRGLPALANFSAKYARLARNREPVYRSAAIRAWYTMVCFSAHPIQVQLPEETLLRLADSLTEVPEYFLSYPPGLDQVHRAVFKMLGMRQVPPKELLLGIYPRKSHPLAGRKANYFLDMGLEDLKDNAPAYLDLFCEVMGAIPPTLLTDDQVCSSLVYAYACAPHLGFKRALQIAIGSVLQPEKAKALTNLIKATGQNMTRLGAMLAETQCLLGRGVNPIDLEGEIASRVAGTAVGAYAQPGLADLEQAIMNILREELPHQVELDDVDKFWAQRFKWCVGGSHNPRANEHWLPRSTLEAVPVGGRWNRRAASEVQATNPLHDWDGTTKVSVAEKLEHGKGRAIYSCDTLNYYAFSWLLSPVERAWKSYRVVLDPGRDGSLGLVNRVRGLAGASEDPCYTMLDYSDFNSQHSLEAQWLVIKCTLRHCTNVDARLAQTLLDSFFNMWIGTPDGGYERVVGTLMSGHRGTTYINSVLNAAYIRCALGEERYAAFKALHVGDDVLMVGGDESLAWRAVTRLESIGCRLQRGKQSIGRLGFEFLRMAGDPKTEIRGYVARAIASLVSGNWVTDWALTPLEALHTLVHQARSVINRSANPNAWRILVRSTTKITKLNRQFIGEFLSGEVAVAPGPCYRADGRYLYRYVTEERRLGIPGARGGATKWRDLPLHASRDYIEEGLESIEREGIRVAGFVPWKAMASSAYATMEPELFRGPDPLTGQSALNVSSLGIRLKEGRVLASTVTTTAAKHGLLAHYPVLSLLKNVLGEADVLHLLQLTGKPFDSTRPYLSAWGGGGEGVTIWGVLPYSDAAGMGSREIDATIIADTKISV